MKLIVAGRHGNYNDRSGSLTEQGIEEARALALAIRSLIPNGSKPLLLTSTLPRAMETAFIIGEHTGVSPVSRDWLREDTYSRSEKVVEGIKGISDGAESIIIVTHFETPAAIMNAFRFEHANQRFECQVAKYGCGYALFLETGEVRPLP